MIEFPGTGHEYLEAAAAACERGGNLADRLSLEEQFRTDLADHLEHIHGAGILVRGLSTNEMLTMHTIEHETADPRHVHRPAPNFRWEPDWRADQ